MASPTCTVTGSSSGGPFATTNGRNMTAAETVTIALSSTAGVTTWGISIVGTDELNVSAPTLTVNSVTKTATFTMPSTATGVALIFQSQINSGLTNGVVDPTLTTTFALFLLNASAWRVGAFNMALEPDAGVGWTAIMNQPIRAAAVGGALSGDVTGTTAASTVVGLTGTANVVAMHGTGITSDTGKALTIKGADFTTASGTAPTFLVQAPNATGSTANGGDLTLTSGTGTSAAGTIRLQVGGSTKLSFNTQFSVLLGLWAYNLAVTTPIIRQDADNTTSIVGQVFTIQAQNATGTTATGGDLVLTSGTGTTAAGSVKLQAGGTTKIQVNATGVGFFAATPAARQTYTTSNHTDARTLNETAATLVQVANVVGTIIKDLQSFGLMA